MQDGGASCGPLEPQPSPAYDSSHVNLITLTSPYRWIHLGVAGVLACATTGNALGQGSDGCATPQAILGAGIFPYDTTISTASGLDFGGAPCETTMNIDVFFAWTSAVAGDTTFSLCTATYDTQLQISLGSDCSAICVANDDNSCGARSEIALAGLNAGDTYLIQVGAFTPGTTGAGSVDISLPAAPPVNDLCSTATMISGSGLYPYDTTFATTSGFDGGDPVLCATSGGTDLRVDAFFDWTAAVGGDFFFATAGGTANPLISMHAGVGCTATCAANNDDGVGIDPEARIVLNGISAGDTYLIQVGEWLPSFAGPGILEIGLWVPPTPPANDICSTATAIVGTGSFPYDRTWAGTSMFDGGDPLLCAQNESTTFITRDVFWSWTATAAGNFTIDNCGSQNNTILNIHLGSGCGAVCLDSNSIGPCATFSESAVTVTGINVGDVLQIQLGDWEDDPTSSAIGILNVSVAAPPPANDDCSTATAIAGVGTTVWSNFAATTSNFNAGMGPCPATAPGLVAGDVFFQWTVPADGDYEFTTIGSVADTELALHSGTACSAVCLAHDDNGGGNFESRIVATGLLTGDPILIQVGTASLVGATMTGTLNIGVAPIPPSNDDCATPTPIAGEGTFAYSSFDATDSGFVGGDGAVCGQASLSAAPYEDLFYTWAPACTGSYRFTTCGQPFDSVLNVHVGSDCSATCLAGANAGLCSGTVAAELVFAATAGSTYLMQVGTWGNGVLTNSSFSITRLGLPCAPSAIVLLCDPANPHHLGGSATLAASTLGAATPSGLHLECTDGPAGEFGFFLVSSGSTTALNIFNGVLCLDSPQGRYNPQVATNQGLPSLNSLGVFDGSGALQNIVGTSATGSGFDVPSQLPFAPAGQTILSGSTWYFQCWFRDQVPPLPNPGSSANFSNVAMVPFP